MQFGSRKFLLPIPLNLFLSFVDAVLQSNDQILGLLSDATDAEDPERKQKRRRGVTPTLHHIDHKLSVTKKSCSTDDAQGIPIDSAQGCSF